MPRRPGEFDDRFIDREIVKADLKKTVPREEVIDPEKIDKIIESAKAHFKHFMTAKVSSKVKEVQPFEISLENMLITLGLNELPQDLAMRKMDEIVLSSSGIQKTESGYRITDIEEVRKDFSFEGITNKVFNILSNNREKHYTYEEVAEVLQLSPASVRRAVTALKKEGKVRFIQQLKKAHDKGSNITSQKDIFTFKKE